MPKGPTTPDESAAIQAQIATGYVKLEPRDYRIDSTLTWDHAVQGELTIEARGASVWYYGTGYALDAKITSGGSGLPSIHVYGGNWIDGQGGAQGFARGGDLRASTWDKLVVKNFSAGPAFTLSNDKYYSERNMFLDVQARDNRQAFYFQSPSGESSFARTHIHNILLTGGVADVCLIDVESDNISVYDSTIGPIHGNITQGAIVMKLNGGLGGTVIGPIGVEQTNGTADAFIFQMGNNLRTAPTIQGPIRMRSTQMFYGSTSQPGTAERLKWLTSFGNGAAATKLGVPKGKVEIFDSTGASLGFVPIYDKIT